MTGRRTHAAYPYLVESTILTSVHPLAAGALAGGLLFMLAPGHAAPRSAEATMHACDASASSHALCQQARTAGAAPRKPVNHTRHAKSLAQRVQCECQTVKAAIRDNEDAEQRVGARGVMESLQQDALSLRKHYRELGC